MRWLGLGTDRHVKDCLTVLDSFDADFEGEAAWPLLKSAITQLLHGNTKAVGAKILREGVLPRDLVLTMAANLSLEKLESGEHHTHRGTLSMIGSSYRTIFSSIVSLQKLLGAISEEERDQALVNMYDAVAESG